MKIPQNQNLHSQSFNSKFLEFVWRFPIVKNKHDQIIFKVSSLGELYFQCSILDDVGIKQENCGYDVVMNLDDLKSKVDWFINKPTKCELVELANTSIKFLKEEE